MHSNLRLINAFLAGVSTGIFIIKPTAIGIVLLTILAIMWVMILSTAPTPGVRCE